MQEELIKQLQAERDALAAKLAFLTEEHTRVTQLYQQQQKGTDVRPPEDENQDEMTETKHLVTTGSHEPEQMNPQNIAQLQTNFAALQVS